MIQLSHLLLFFLFFHLYVCLQKDDFLFFFPFSIRYIFHFCRTIDGKHQPQHEKNVKSNSGIRLNCKQPQRIQYLLWMTYIYNFTPLTFNWKCNFMALPFGLNLWFDWNIYSISKHYFHFV